MAAEITGGEVSDYKGYDLVMQADAPAPKVLLADRGYDGDRIRADLEARGAVPMIPGRKTRKAPIVVDDFVYALRNQVERAINKLKTHAASPHVTTKPPPATWASSTSQAFASGSDTLSTEPRYRSDTSKNLVSVGFDGMLMVYGWRFCRFGSAFDAVLA